LSSCSSLNVGEGLLKTLTSTLGISDTQALGGAGALLQLAKDQLSTGEFDKIAKIIPGPLNSLDDVKPIFENLGMSGDLVGQFIPVISNYASVAGGSDVSDLLGSVLK